MRKGLQECFRFLVAFRIVGISLFIVYDWYVNTLLKLHYFNETSLNFLTVFMTTIS